MSARARGAAAVGGSGLDESDAQHPLFMCGMKLEADLSTLLLSTEDRKEAGLAFREKRKPRFTGK